MPEELVTVFYDDGRAPHFERDLRRAIAEARVKELHSRGIISAIILEDYQ